MLVLVEHLTLAVGLPAWANALNFGHIGYVGVSMFFAISGYLITLLLVREWNATAAISLTDFYRRRALRILPAYFVFLVVVFALTRLRAFAISPDDWRAALTYTMNFNEAPAWEVGHLWSLSVEEQFYLIWPILFIWLRPDRARKGLIGLMFVMPTFRVLLWSFSPPVLERFNEVTPLRVPIAAGCLLALLSTQAALPRGLASIQRHAMRYAATSMLLLILSFEMARWSWGYGATLRFSIDAVALGVLIWAVANAAATVVGRVLEASPVVFLGLLSYSAYLWQQLLLDPHHRYGALPWSYHALLAVLAVLTSYFAIEKPFLRWKNRKRNAAPHRRDEPTASDVVC
jgi:peptidoglycan/LPS O-acetylase OafA/YrhL